MRGDKAGIQGELALLTRNQNFIIDKAIHSGFLAALLTAIGSSVSYRYPNIPVSSERFLLFVGDLNHSAPANI